MAETYALFRVNVDDFWGLDVAPPLTNGADYL